MTGARTAGPAMLAGGSDVPELPWLQPASEGPGSPLRPIVKFQNDLNIIAEERRAAQFLPPLAGVRIAVKVANLSDEPHSRQLDTNHTNKHFIKAVICLFQVPGFGRWQRENETRWCTTLLVLFSYLKEDGENGLLWCVHGQRTPDNFPCMFNFVRFLSTCMCCRFYYKCHDYCWALCYQNTH